MRNAPIGKKRPPGPSIFVLGGLALALAGLPGCKDTTRSGVMAQPSKTAPPGHDIDTAKAVKASGPSIDAGSTVKKSKTFSKATIDELKKSVPSFEKARITTPLKPTPHSRLARMVLCIKRSVPAAQKDIAESFAALSWADMVIHTPPHDAKRRSFSANSKRFRVNGTLLQGEFKDCPEKSGHTKLTLSFQERQPPPAPKTLVPPMRMKKL